MFFSVCVCVFFRGVVSLGFSARVGVACRQHRDGYDQIPPSATSTCRFQILDEDENDGIIEAFVCGQQICLWSVSLLLLCVCCVVVVVVVAVVGGRLDWYGGGECGSVGEIGGFCVVWKEEVERTIWPWDYYID